MTEPEQICLMSEVNGRLMKAGKPLPDTKLVRQLSYVYKDGFHIEEIASDAQGYFQFPAVFEKKKPFAFLNIFQIGQVIEAVVDDEKIIIWQGLKYDKEENAEARGQSIEITCHTDKKEKNKILIDDSRYFVRCDWDVQSDAEPEYKLSEDY